MGIGSEHGGLYVFNQGINTNKQCIESNMVCCISKTVWHNRLGHPSSPVLDVLKDTLNLGKETLPVCDVCHQAKQTRDPFPLSEHKSSSLGDLIHVDVWDHTGLPLVKGTNIF